MNTCGRAVIKMGQKLPPECQMTSRPLKNTALVKGRQWGQLGLSAPIGRGHRNDLDVCHSAMQFEDVELPGGGGVDPYRNRLPLCDIGALMRLGRIQNNAITGLYNIGITAASDL